MQQFEAAEKSAILILANLGIFVLVLLVVDLWSLCITCERAPFSLVSICYPKSEHFKTRMVYLVMQHSYLYSVISNGSDVVQ